MGKLYKEVQSRTEIAVKATTANNVVKTTLNTAKAVGSAIGDARQIAGKAVLLSLSKAWIGIGITRPAKTERAIPSGMTSDIYARLNYNNELSETVKIDRFDTSKMWSIRFGSYFMPLSQTYSVRAKKRLNISSLVDGIDIIQQTRKEAKTIDCTLKISVNEAQENLQIVVKDEEGVDKIAKLQEMLSELYENDVVFLVDNETLNATLGIKYAIMDSYKFTPRVGSKTYIFEFSLTEVKFGDNILTFDEKQIQAPVETETNLLA